MNSTVLERRSDAEVFVLPLVQTRRSRELSLSILVLSGVSGRVRALTPARLEFGSAATWVIVYRT